MTISRPDKTSEVYDKVALWYFNNGYTPEAVLANLKESGYKVNLNGKINQLDGVVVANIVRGIAIGKALAEPAKPKRGRPKGSKNKPTEIN